MLASPSTASAPLRPASSRDGERPQRFTNCSASRKRRPAPEPPPPATAAFVHRACGTKGIELLDRLAAAVNFSNVLSEWEAAFASDVSRRYARAAQLTEKQRAVAERIVLRAKRAALAGAQERM